MKYSFSNIAWGEEDNDLVYRWLVEYGFHGIDVAPGRIGPNPYEDRQSVKRFKVRLDNYRLDIGGMQSLLFGQNDLQLFEDVDSRKKLLSHLTKVISLADKIGCGRLVFGSPKNRAFSKIDYEEACSIAKYFFVEVAERCKNYEIEFCLEPNPKIYDTNFLNFTSEALTFVREVGHPNLKINLDSGAAIENEEKLTDIINSETIPCIGHVHISQPYLVTIDVDNPVHKNILDRLRSLNYAGWVSIEMKQDPEAGVDAVKQVIQFFSNNYLKGRK